MRLNCIPKPGFYELSVNVGTIPVFSSSVLGVLGLLIISIRGLRTWGT